jgi:hypothetical protein
MDTVRLGPTTAAVEKGLAGPAVGYRTFAVA